MTETPLESNLRNLTEEELEIEINQVYNSIQHNPNALFQFFYFYNHRTNYIPLDDIIRSKELVEEGMKKADRYAIMSVGAFALFDALYFRKVISSMSLIKKTGIRAVSYFAISFFGYGYGYETGLKPSLEFMQSSIERNNLQYSKFHNIYWMLYKERVGSPLKDFEISK